MEKRGIRTRVCRTYCTVTVLAIGLLATGMRTNAQTPDTATSFEVASVRPLIRDASHPFNPRHFGAHVTPAGASYLSMSVQDLIDHAYGIERNQVTGPEWVKVDSFDIEARFPEGADKKDERKMLQTLLKDRFKLAFHIESKELEVNALVVGKRGEKLQPSLPDPVTPEDTAHSQPGENNPGDGPAKSKIIKNADGSSTVDLGKQGKQTIKFDQEKSSLHFEESKMTMEQLASRLSICLGMGFHKVVDETGIEGNYQIAFDCPQPGPPRSAGTGADSTLPSDPDGSYLLTQSLDALGLKLEKRKIQTYIYVIDHVERPSEN